MALIGTLFPAYFIGACAPIGVSAERQGDVRVIELKSNAGPVGWLDNETIVAIGQTGESYARKDGAMQPIARVMTLNYRTGEQKLFGKISSEFCFSDGYVSYAFLDRATDELWVSYGELGSETTRKIKPGELNFDRGSRGSCRPWSERPKPPSWAKENTAIWPLSPYKGLLNCNVAAATASTQYVKARFHKPNDEQGVELPFSCYEVSMGLKYYPFKGAYFSFEFDFRIPWPAGRDRRAFWLFPDGTVETQLLKYSTAIRAGGIPTAKGIVTFATPARAFAEPASAEADYWIYLVTPMESKRILPGHGSGVTSPDGCKVAMLHDPEYKARINNRSVTTRVTLKVLDLCETK